MGWEINWFLEKLNIEHRFTSIRPANKIVIYDLKKIVHTLEGKLANELENVLGSLWATQKIIDKNKDDVERRLEIDLAGKKRLVPIPTPG